MKNISSPTHAGIRPAISLSWPSTAVTLFVAMMLLAATRVWAWSPNDPAYTTNYTDVQKTAQRTAGTAMLSALAAARSAHATSFTITGGVYRISGSRPLGGSGDKNFAILCTNTPEIIREWTNSTLNELWFPSSSASNVSLVGPLIYDADPLPYTEGRILSYNSGGKTMQIKVLPGYIAPITTNTSGRWLVFNTNGIWVGHNFAWFYGSQWVDQANGILQVSVDSGLSSLYAPSNYVAMPWANAGPVVNFYNMVTNVTIQDIYCYLGCASLFAYGGPTFGYCNYLGIKAVPRPGTSRLLGGGSAQASACGTNSSVTFGNCEMCTTIDDDMDYTMGESMCVTQLAPSVVVIYFNQYSRAYTAGDTLRFMAFPSYTNQGSATVSASVTTNSATLTSMAENLVKNVLNYADGTLNSLKVVTLNSSVAVSPGAIVEDRTGNRIGSFVMTNCYFHDCSVRVMPQGMAKGLIANNRFDRINLGLYVSMDAWWWEGPSCDNVVITNNVFNSTPYNNWRGDGSAILFGPSHDATDAGASATTIFTNVLIAGNTFSNCSGDGIHINCASPVVISNNIINSVALGYSAIHLYAAGKAVVGGNTVLNCPGVNLLVDKYSTNVQLLGNIFINPNWSDGGANARCVVRIVNSTNVFLTNNLVYNPGPYCSNLAVAVNSSLIVGLTNGISIAGSLSVSITNPASGAVFGQGANIAIGATTSDSSGTVTNVSFYQGTTLLGTDTTAPYGYAWNNVSGGDYSLTARAKDNAGLTVTSAVVNISVDIPPTVNLTAPTNGAVYPAGTNITLSANASDTYGTVTNVSFYQGTTLLGNDTTSPYSYAWNNVSAGNYSLTARATDNAGLTTTSSVVNITVNSSMQPPTVSLTAPTNGAVYAAGTNITLSASVTDTNGTASGTNAISIQFQGNGTGNGLTNQAAGVVAEAIWNVIIGGTGTYSNFVDATSASVTTFAQVVSGTVEHCGGDTSNNGKLLTGFLGPTSTIITVSNVPYSSYNVYVYAACNANGGIAYGMLSNSSGIVASNNYKSCSITFADGGGGAIASGTFVQASTSGLTNYANYLLFTNLSGSSFTWYGNRLNGSSTIGPAGIQIVSVTSSASSAVTNVSFYQGTTLLGSDTNSPYNFNWTNVPAGAYSLTAVASDSYGLSGTSAVVNITVTGGTNAIDIQFQGNGTGNGLTNQAAGVVAESVWNVIVGGAGIYSNFVDATSTSVTTSVNVISGTVEHCGGDTSNNGKLLTGFLGPTSTIITVSNVPYSSYSVYVYAACNANGGIAWGMLSNSTGIVASNNYKSCSITFADGGGGAIASGTFVQASTSGLTNYANYLLFTNLSGSSFTWYGNRLNGSSTIGPAGIQIVSIGGGGFGPQGKMVSQGVAIGDSVTVGSQPVTVISPAVVLASGQFQVGCQGAPNHTYTVDRATAITGPWEIGWTNITAGPTGQFQVVDPDPTRPSSRFYRINP